ncbi:MAG: M28 family peptidase [Campylobacterota bacterium]
MQDFLSHFQTISKIPHCSFHTASLRDHIALLAKEYGYEVNIDKAGNICCYSPKDPKMTLQAHYDMVCMGRAPDITLEQNAEILTARESSLGADNGMACAMMLALMQEGAAVDCLFTNDEEVGMLGANALELPLRGDKLLNLDSEEEGKIYLGCAGGVDLDFYYAPQYKACSYPNFYELTIDTGGGHSGIDIDKGIDNAVIVLASFLQGKTFELISFEGGSKSNVIPGFCKAVVAANTLQSTDAVRVIPIHDPKQKALTSGKTLIDDLATCPNGVLRYDSELQTVQDSCNVAIVEEGRIHISVRSQSKKGLEDTAKRLQRHFGAYRCEQSGWYQPWEPVETKFAHQVRSSYPGSSFAAIHAGLECALLQQKYPHMQMVSIGPDIVYPHSVKEYTNLGSCKRIFKLIKTLL